MVGGGERLQSRLKFEILFSKNLNLKILSTEEIEKGRVLMVAGEINDLKVIFINVYAPNNGSDRVEVFRKLQSALRKCDNDSCIIMGGDWNWNKFSFGQEQRGVSSTV